MPDKTEVRTETDEVVPAPLSVSDVHHVPVVFVNQVLNHGILNGVVNVTLATANFTPSDGTIETDLTITSRLRMDMYCATQLRDALNAILTQAAKKNGETEH